MTHARKHAARETIFFTEEEYIFRRFVKTRYYFAEVETFHADKTHPNWKQNLNRMRYRRLVFDIAFVVQSPRLFSPICSDISLWYDGRCARSIRIRKWIIWLARSAIRHRHTERYIRYSRRETQCKFDYVRNSIWRSARISRALVTCLITLSRI